MQSKFPFVPARFESLESRLLLSSYFVSPSGSDAAPGTLAAPWESLAHALGVASSGDVINLRGGTYSGGVSVNRPNITIQAYNGEKALIASPYNNSSVDTALRINADASGTVLRNLDISGGYYYTLKTESTYDTGAAKEYGASNILIESTRLHDSGRDVIKIAPGSNHVTIRNSEIFNSGRRDPSNAEGIDNVNGDYMTVQGTYIHDITTNAIYAKGGAVGAVIERNYVSNIGHGGILLGQDTDYEWFDHDTNPKLYESIDGVVRNNIIVNTQGAGIAAYAALRGKFYNNTLVNVAQSMQAGVLIAGMEHYLPPSYSSPLNIASENVEIVNNIVHLGGSTRPALQVRANGLAGNLTTKHNRYYRSGGTVSFWDDRRNFYGNLGQWQSSGQDAGSSEGNPKLDASHHLFSDSPVIDAGASLSSVSEDYDRQPRPAGKGWDIGADEFAGTSPTPTPDPTPPPPPPTPMPAGNGLTAQYFDNRDFTALHTTRVDAKVDFGWGSGAPIQGMGSNTFSVRWTGKVAAQHSETYTFYTGSDDGVRLWVNGKLLIDNWTQHRYTENRGSITLQAGVKYDIKMEYFENKGAAAARLMWSSASTSKQIVPTSALFTA